jgi:hypothetical protein
VRWGPPPAAVACPHTRSWPPSLQTWGSPSSSTSEQDVRVGLRSRVQLLMAGCRGRALLNKVWLPRGRGRRRGRDAGGTCCSKGQPVRCASGVWSGVGCAGRWICVSTLAADCQSGRHSSSRHKSCMLHHHLQARVHVCMRTYEHSHTHLHWRTRVCARVRAHTHTHTHTHRHICTQTHAHMHTRSHAHMRMHTKAVTPAHLHAYSQHKVHGPGAPRGRRQH